jgi:hypothetical protein
MKKLLTILALAASLTACAEPLDPASKLLTSRVLGLYFMPDEDPARANPRPGESGVLEVFVVDPAEELPRSYLLVACLPAPVSFGPGFCAGPPFAVADVTAEPGDPVTPPALPLTAPDEVTLGETSVILVLGAVCSGGPVNSALLGLLSGSGSPPESIDVCEDPALDGTLVSFYLPIERGDPPNLHPTIDSILLDEAPFTATSPPDASMTGCEGDPAYPAVRADGEERTITIRVPEGAREFYEAVDPETDEPFVVREELQVGRFATEGKVRGTFGFIDEDRLENELRWEAPETAPPGGALVRFVFTLRDGRGGFASARRELCLVP